MKITKYIHSCLLAETKDRVALFDPGIFSWQSGLFDLDSIDRIDRIVITHAHGDHFYPDFVKAVLGKFPEAEIVANKAVERAAKEAGIDAKFRGTETECTKPFEAPHELLPIDGEVPLNTGFHFQGLLTHPGDSHSFNETKEILALPIVAPWGSTTDAVNLAKKLKPKHIIPIHDWHYSDTGRNWLFKLLTESFAQDNIEFHSILSGEPLEV